MGKRYIKFIVDEIQTANKNMKRFLTSLIFREMLIKMTLGKKK